MPHNEIDALLGPERNPRQGFWAADILRWQDQRRKRRLARRPEPESPVAVPEVVDTGMDEFFATVGEPSGGGKPPPAE